MDIALPIYIDNVNVDNIYDGESTYNNINKTPVSVYVYIPTNISTNWRGGELNFWFEEKNGSNKYACTLNNSAHVKGIAIANNGTIIDVISNTTISGFTILCQFTMTSNNTVFNITILLMLILFIYSLKLFKLIT